MAATHRYLAAAAFLRRFRASEITQLCDASGSVTTDLFQQAIDGTLPPTLAPSDGFLDVGARDGFDIWAFGPGVPVAQSGVDAGKAYLFSERAAEFANNETLFLDDEEFYLEAIGDTVGGAQTSTAASLTVMHPVCYQNSDVLTVSAEQETCDDGTSNADQDGNNSLHLILPISQGGRGANGTTNVTHTIGETIRITRGGVFVGPLFARRAQRSTAAVAHATGAWMRRATDAPAATLDLAVEALAVLDAALDDAEDLADSYLGSRVALPLTDVPPVLAQHIATLTYYNLHDLDVSETVQKKYDQALQWFVAVRDGKIVLLAPDETLEPRSGTVLSSRTEGSRAFADEKMQGFR